MENLLSKEFRRGPETSLQLLVASPVTVQLTLAPKLVQTKVRQLEDKPSGKSDNQGKKQLSSVFFVGKTATFMQHLAIGPMWHL